jgi:hypothetical protein
MAYPGPSRRWPCTPDERDKLEWFAIYGASVAVQQRERMVEGRGPVDLDEMVDIVEEAEAVADSAAEAREEQRRQGR